MKIWCANSISTENIIEKPFYFPNINKFPSFLINFGYFGLSLFDFQRQYLSILYSIIIIIYNILLFFNIGTLLQNIAYIIHLIRGLFKKDHLIWKIIEFICIFISIIFLFIYNNDDKNYKILLILLKIPLICINILYQ